MKTYPETPIGQPKPPTNCVACEFCKKDKFFGHLFHLCLKSTQDDALLYKLVVLKEHHRKRYQRKRIKPPANCPLKQPKTYDPTP